MLLCCVSATGRIITLIKHGVAYEFMPSSLTRSYCSRVVFETLQLTSGKGNGHFSFRRENKEKKESSVFPLLEYENQLLDLRPTQP